MAIELSALQALIAQHQARWKAGATAIMQLPAAERLKRLGAKPPQGQSLEQRERAAKENLYAHSVKGVGYPATYDLRNVGGTSFITPIRDQGGCGSCVAFGTCATIEGALQVLRNDATINPDLSEAHLFYCLGGSGVTCETGWWPDYSFDAAKSTGIADEACYPYTAGDQSCNACADWQSHVTQLSNWHSVSAAADMKTWISTNGPVSACFTVYEDFFAYQGGVYTHVSGDAVGGHCVSVVGYDDVGGYWICKNSWGTGWGEAGFFRIAYAECGIDVAMWCADGIVDTGWQNNIEVKGLWSIDQDLNAWAYLGSLGWRKISPDNTNIFIDMLSQLASAKAGGRPVNAYLNQGVIQQLYVF